MIPFWESENKYMYKFTRMCRAAIVTCLFISEFFTIYHYYFYYLLYEDTYRQRILADTPLVIFQ